jgi:hypothetical protein
MLRIVIKNIIQEAIKKNTTRCRLQQPNGIKNLMLQEKSGTCERLYQSNQKRGTRNGCKFNQRLKHLVRLEESMGNLSI